ncbi:MAG: ribonuclease HI family protein [Anaerolineales bacterium]|nr:ribonuclease HI family protein [Anaerolineales bacterium]MCB9126653.1 ribonuclease HI family protein [Ardenticatenales bacterium]
MSQTITPMSAEALLEELMLLPIEEQERFFTLVRKRAILRQRMAGTSTSSAEAAREPRAPSGEADYRIIWDGGSKGNPGQGYGSYQLTAVRSGKSRTESLEFPGRMTNNEAEYETLISALDTLASKIRQHGRNPRDYTLDLRGDSKLVISQVKGEWKAKDDRMAKYRDNVRTLLAQFGHYTLTHHDRSKSVEVLGH